MNDRHLQNIAYLRLKNLQVGYSFSRQWISKARVENLRIYVSGENLFSWSPLYKHTRDYDITNTSSGSDPDLTSGTSGDNYTYPLMKSVTLGISITF